MNPNVQKVLGLPELREPILTNLLFDEHRSVKISTFQIFRLVCRPWLETANHLIYQNLKNIKDPYENGRKYVPVRFDYKRIPDFIQLMTNNCLKTAPALPFELVLTSNEDKLTEREHHTAIRTLINKFPDGLIKILLRSPCNLENLHLPNLQILTAIISSADTEKGIDKDIQAILDGAQDSVHFFTVCINNLPTGARVLPVRLPEKLQSLCVHSFWDVLHVENLLSHNLGSVPNLKYLHIYTKSQTTFSNPELLYQFLSNCPHIKSIFLYNRRNFGNNRMLCQFALPETLKHLEYIGLNLFGNFEKPKKSSALSETSERYPKWKALQIRGFTKEDLNICTEYYPSRSLKLLKYFEQENGDEIPLGLNIFHLKKIRLAYPNLTYLDICVENEKSLEYIFSEMTNLKTLHVRHEGHERTCINWDAVLIGCSKTEIKKLREDYNQEGMSVLFDPNEELPSIRNMKNLQTLMIYADDSVGVVPDEYQLSDVAFLCAFLKMDSLLKLEIWIRNRVSENIQQIWTSLPKRSIYVRKYFT